MSVIEKSTVDVQELKFEGLKANERIQQQTIPDVIWHGFKRILVSDYFILMFTIVGYIIAAQLFDRLSNVINIANQFSNMWPLFAVAIGQTFVLIIAGIDLSQGAIMAVVSVIGAMLISSELNPSMFDKLPLWGTFIDANGGPLAGSNVAMPAAVILMLFIGTFIGLINGTLITRFNITPFIATLVTSIFFSYFALWLTQSRNISGLPESFIKLGDSGQIVSIYVGEKLESTIRRRDIPTLISSATLIALGLSVVAGFTLRKTAFGKRMYAIGTNPRAAIVSGVPNKRMITMVYMFSGFCAAVASIIYTARLEIGRPTLGSGNILLDIIGACVIGGTSLFGGKGSIKGTFFGVMFFTLLLNVLNAARLSPFVIDAVKGGVILLAALLDITRTRFLNSEQST